jgi:transposase
VSGALERFLLARGERIVRVAPGLMAGARRAVRERGKSDAIDAVAIARAAIREGLDTLPVARLAGPELDVRLLVDHRERLVAQRTRLINDLRWGLHDLWPEFEIPERALIGRGWHQRVAGRLRRAEPSVRVRSPATSCAASASSPAPSRRSSASSPRWSPRSRPGCWPNQAAGC